MDRKLLGRILTTIGLVALPVYVLCFSVFLPELFRKDLIPTGYLFIFVLIAVGYSLQKNSEPVENETRPQGLMVRRPIRILSGMITVLGLIGMAGASVAYIKENDPEILPVLLLVGVSVSFSAFVAWTGRAPFGK